MRPQHGQRRVRFRPNHRTPQTPNHRQSPTHPLTQSEPTRPEICTHHYHHHHTSATSAARPAPLLPIGPVCTTMRCDCLAEAIQRHRCKLSWDGSSVAGSRRCELFGRRALEEGGLDRRQRGDSLTEGGPKLHREEVVLSEGARRILRVACYARTVLCVEEVERLAQRYVLHMYYKTNRWHKPLPGRRGVVASATPTAIAAARRRRAPIWRCV